jgi:hypothetical protein
VAIFIFQGSSLYTTSPTTPYLRNERKKFVITNPLHPLQGKEFEAINYRHGVKISSVFFHDSNGRSQLVPVDWTDIVPEDPYLIISEGRSLFRYEDLVSLAKLIKNIDCELG